MRIASMATATPGERDTRNTTGTRLDQPARIEPGSVVLCGDRFAVALRVLDNGMWIVLPVTMQTGPLHRSHVIVALDDAPDVFRDHRGRMLIRTAEPRLMRADVAPVGRVLPALMDKIELTLRRAIEAEAGDA
jgi:hypothetical protein